MKREHSTKPVIPEPYIWLPFTSNAADEKGVLGTLNGTCSGFSSNGALFNGIGGLYKTGFSISNDKFTTISMEIMLPQLYTSDIYTIFRYLKIGYQTFNGIAYAPGWGQDINCAVYYNNAYDALSISSVPFVANQWYNLVIRQEFDNNITHLYVNGQKRNSCNIVIQGNETMTGIYIGRQNNSGRVFKGYIRNFRTWEAALTDEQIAAL